MKAAMKVPASGAVLGLEEKAAMHAVVDSGWLTAGPINRQFEESLERFTAIRHARTCNSGSSANLLAVAAMVESGHWKAGDEIITAAVGFPTTVNPLLIYGLIPVFVDVEIGTYNVNYHDIENIFEDSDDARGVILAHTLGNPFDWRIRRNIPTTALLIEDCCDALGGKYDYDRINVGTQADISTCSFFPAHHITTGEGGAVFTNDSKLVRTIESIRDWGRDCYCQPGKNNTCGKRFDQQFGNLPYGYDHKYTFTHLGYNLKMNEVGAACGLEQMKKLPSFIEARRRNFDFLWTHLEHLQDRLILPVATEGSSPSWFGFPITLKESGLRNHMQRFLDGCGVDTRLLFGGNLTRQPYMKDRNFRISGSLANSDKIMEDSFWIGLHPQLSEEQLAYSCEMIGKALDEL